jgi:hypothetical protein
MCKRTSCKGNSNKKKTIKIKTIKTKKGNDYLSVNKGGMHKGGMINYEMLKFGVLDDSISSNIVKDIVAFLKINKNYLDSFLQLYKNKIISYENLSRLKNDNINNIKKYQLIDIIYNINKKFEFVYNHKVNNYDSITAGKFGYHIYVYIIPNQFNKYNYELMGIVKHMN